MRICVEEAREFFAHPSQRIHGITPESLPDDGFQYWSRGYLCLAVHPAMFPGVWGAHIAAKPQGWGKMDDDGKALLNEIWDALRPLRLVGWVETWRRSVIAFALRCGWIEDGRFRAGSEEIVMIGWSR